MALNDALADQQTRISALEARVEALLDRVRALSEAAAGGDAGEELPPHY